MALVYRNFKFAELEINFSSRKMKIAVDLLNRECAAPTAKTEKLEKRLVLYCCVTMMLRVVLLCDVLCYYVMYCVTI